MQSLSYLHKEFYFFQRFKHALRKSLHQSLIKNSRVKDARSSLFMWRFYILQRFKHALPIID